MPQTTTLIFISSHADARWAIHYSDSHPKEKIKLFPTDIPALLYLLQTQPRLINRIDAYVKFSHRLQSNLRLPLTLAQQVITANPQRKLLVEVFRAEFTKALSHYYILYQLNRQIHCRKIVASPSSLSSLTVRQFAQDFGLDYKFIPPTHPSWPQQLQHQLISHLKPLNWFFHHPQELLLFLIHLLLRSSPTQAAVLIFSNGLNLASYHRVVRTLADRTSVKIITDKQSWLDKLYLAKYGIRGSQLSKYIPNLQPNVDSQIKLKSFKSVPWFISAPSLKQLIHDTALRIIKRSSHKILLKFATAQQLIRQCQPKLVITTHDPGPSGLSFVTAAQDQGINTAVLLHGAPSHIHFFYSDYQFIWGKLMRRWLIKTGLSPRQLKLGGCPIYIDYQRYFSRHQSKPPLPTIGILTTGDGRYEWYQALYFYDLFRSLRSFSHHRLLVRTHGMQYLSAVVQLARHFGLHVTLNPPLHLEEFVVQCDLVISQNSTAALVPLLAHKPTILVDPWFPFLDEGLIKSSPAFFKPKNVQQLVQIIKKFSTKSPSPSYFAIQDKYINQFCGPLDTKIGDRIAQKLLKLIP